VNTAAARADAAAAGAEVALVFGTETSGLSNDELSRCTLAATIPANAEYPSLNLAAAVQVVAWEIRRAAGMRGDDEPASRRGFAAATHDEVEALYAHAQRTLGALEFLDARRPRRLFQRLRRLFGRTRLEREEVNILRGILARVDERIGASGAARIAVPPPEAKR
jgi:tRNA/rRNA methyltransferase